VGVAWSLSGAGLLTYWLVAVQGHNGGCSERWQFRGLNYTVYF